MLSVQFRVNILQAGSVIVDRYRTLVGEKGWQANVEVLEESGTHQVPMEQHTRIVLEPGALLRS